MAQTVTECLTAAEDSAIIINDVKTNGKKSIHLGGTADKDTKMSQADINELIQRNVDHLELILAYDGSDDKPNIVGSSSSKKTTCSDAVTTGKAYISANS
jgi:hypothetical protein|tara:strand:- start:13 stop:312 length:300 start_codon:yes stop_codon:yes gene_type:complete